MRISDWSSDVCSSDPRPGRRRAGRRAGAGEAGRALRGRSPSRGRDPDRGPAPARPAQGQARKEHRRRQLQALLRSEERREGKSVSVRVDLGGSRTIKKKKKTKKINKHKKNKTR